MCWWCNFCRFLLFMKHCALVHSCVPCALLILSPRQTRSDTQMASATWQPQHARKPLFSSGWTTMKKKLDIFHVLWKHKSFLYMAIDCSVLSSVKLMLFCWSEQRFSEDAEIAQWTIRFYDLLTIWGCPIPWSQAHVKKTSKNQCIVLHLHTATLLREKWIGWLCSGSLLDVGTLI